MNRVLPNLRLRRCAFAGLAFAFALSTQAQLGDRPNDDTQRPPSEEWRPPAAPVRAPEDALASFVVPPGFRVELVAAEPLVADPVAIAFDERGRLWVAELPAYNAEILKQLPVYLQKGQSTEAPRGRIVCLEDTDRDGRMDKRTVFLDGLTVPRAVAIYGDAVLVGDPPHLWLCRDRNGDGVADEKTELANDYGTEVAVETAPNGLLWNLDNWLYNAGYTWRLRPDGTEWRREPMPALGQWGITQDDVGRMFYNRNSDQLRGDFLPPHYAAKLPRNARSLSFNVAIATDQQVFPIRPTPGVNRGYRKDFLRPDGTLVAFTAAAAPLVYRGVNFPSHYYGNVFVPEPGANTIKRNVLLEREGRLTAVNGFELADFMSSADERFRPVFMANGPDGALYVADLYRGILEAYQSITTFLRDQILERGLNTPLWGLGRIYRVVHVEGARPTVPDFTRATPAQRVAWLEHSNGWTRDMAQRAIVVSAERAHIEHLEKLLASASHERTRLHVLWTLEGLGAVKPGHARGAVRDPSAQVRRAGWRIAERWLASAERDAFIGIFSEQVAIESPEVLAQAVLSWSTAVGAEQARPAIHAALPRAAEHPALLDAVGLAMRGDEVAALEHLQTLARGALPPFGHRALFRSLAEALVGNGAAGQAKLVEALLDAHMAEPVRLALMQGVSATGDGAKGRRAPGTGRMAPAALERLEREAPDPAVRRGAGVLLNELRQEQVRTTRRGKAAPLTATQQASFELGRTHYLLCAGCHQPDGEGKDGVAPSLRQARWATHSSPEFAIRIVLSGKEGTPGYPGAMAPMGGLSDEQISSVLTYIRRSWGNEAGAVSAADVAQIRANLLGRTATWTDSELEKLERGGGKP